MQEKKRVEWIDIAKGIGIILVVWGHSMTIFQDEIYQFHMPLFFLLSGYVYNSKIDLKKFILNKIYSLYIPFVTWNVIGVIIEIMIIHNGSLLKRIIGTILTLDKSGAFFGATWFLGALFVVSILYKVLDTCINCKWKIFIIIIIFLQIALLGYICELPYKIDRTLMLSIYYAVGVLIRKYKCNSKCIENNVLCFLICLCIFLMVSNCILIDYPYIGALSGSGCIIYISKIIERLKVKSFFTYMGKRSIDIVIWHFICFRFVIIMQLIIYEEPLMNIINYYPTYNDSNLWGIIYVMIGIIGSLMIGFLLRKGIWGKCLKKFHIV